jgi:hypothetical protein
MKKRLFSGVDQQQYPVSAIAPIVMNGQIVEYQKLLILLLLAVSARTSKENAKKVENNKNKKGKKYFLEESI